MNVIIKFEYYADIIEIPDYLIPDLKKTYIKFGKWLFDKNNNHGYWVIKDGRKYGILSKSESFVEWLNKYILFDNKEKAKIVQKKVCEFDKNLPILFF